MAVGSYSQSELNSAVTTRASGTFTVANFLVFANDAIRELISEIDLRSSIRKVALSPNLFDDIYQYTCPTTLKSDRIIDVQPQIDRAGRGDYWELVTAEEFDRLKSEGRTDRFGDPLNIVRKGESYSGANLIAISRDDLVNKLLLSRPVDDNETGIDALDAVGDWAGYGDGGTLTTDSDNYVKGNASINWDINADGGTTAGIYNASLDTFDVSDYIGTGSIFVWAYITSATNLTNFIIRIGSSASAYYSITITTNNEGASFYAGWNLLRFDFVNKSETGTVDQDACDYVALYMTKDSSKVSETDYRFDNLVIKMGNYYDVVFYTRYPWQSSTGTYLEDATATTDLLNMETDEFNLAVLKTLQFAEEHLKKYKEADRWEKKYEAKKAEYIMRNPSQALILQQTYHHL